MDDLKFLKDFVGTIFSNKAHYLFYNREEDSWYYITVINKDELNSNSYSNLVVSEVKFKFDKFKLIFMDVFGKLFDTINKQPNNYLIELSKLNLFINNALKSKVVNKEDLKEDDILTFIKFDLKVFIERVKNRVCNYDVAIPIDIDYKLIETKGISFINVIEEVRITQLADKKLLIPFKNGHMVSISYLKQRGFEFDKLQITLYTSDYRVCNYSINYEDSNVIINSMQPFSIVVPN